MLSEVKNDNKKLILNIKKWNSELNGIYDYSSSSVKQIKVYIAEDTYIVRTKYNSFVKKSQHENINFKDGENIIFQVNNGSNDTYYLVNPIPKHLKMTDNNFNYINNKIWYVIKNENIEDDLNSNEDYFLNENDLIKLGRVKYAVQKISLKEWDNSINEEEAPIPVAKKQYNISNLNKNKLPTFDFIYEVKNNSNQIDNQIDINETVIIEKDNDKCKICHIENNNNLENDDDDGNNFLISLCKCKEFVHYRCIKNNIKQKILLNKNKKKFDDSILIKEFECSECGTQYPLKFKLPGVDEIYNLVDIKEPTDCNFLILESIDYRQNEKYYKSIHVIKFLKNKNIITIGGDSDNDVIVSDISISGKHAVLKYIEERGKICIENRNKNFGTSVLVKEPIKVLDKKIFLHVGETYIECNLISKEANQVNLNYDKK